MRTRQVKRQITDPERSFVRLKNGPTIHNNPYPTPTKSTTYSDNILSAAFRTIYDHARHFYGSELGFRQFSVLTGVPSRTLHRVYQRDHRLSPRTRHRLGEWLSDDKFTDVLRSAAVSAVVDEPIVFNPKLSRNRLYLEA